MSEFRNLIISGVAVGALGAGLQGCSAVDNAKAAHSLVHEDPSINRCYDTPQPDEYVPYKVPPPPQPKLRPGETEHSYDQRLRKLFSHAEHLRKLHERNPYFLPPLDIKYQAGSVEGDPGVSASTAAQVSKSVVDISTKQWYGTGFLAKDAAGDEVVVTAAHVVRTAGLSQLTIKAQDGQKVHPTGGCYMYENRGRFLDIDQTNSTEALSASNTPNIDIAVLTLPHRLSRYALKLSTQPVERGDWTLLVNDSDNKPQQQTAYTGFVATTAQDKYGYRVLTGLEPLQGTDVPLDKYEAQPGASGGPIVNTEGQVVGMSTYASPEEGQFLSADDLQHYYAVKVHGAEIGPASGIVPVSAYSVSQQNLAAALQSTVLKQ